MATIQQTEDYERFLTRATALLAASGAQLLLGPDMPPGHAPASWLEGWDRLLASNQPGAQAVYAFTDGREVSRDEIRERLDRLARGLAESGFLQGPPLKLFAVVAYSGGPDGVRPRTLTGLTPQAYLPGLRPRTWAVDLDSGQVHAGGLMRPEEAKQLELAASKTAEGAAFDPGGIGALQQVQQQRNLAFYQLMRERQPYVTYALIAVNVAIFGLLNLNGGPDNVSTLRDFGALSPTLVEHGQWWRIFTSMFLHASVTHILFNMASLFAIGTLAERLYGSTRFLAIYLGAGLIGSLASLLYASATGNPNELGVGASGAIFGVAGALLTVRYQSSDVIPQRLRNQISTSLLPLVALSLVFAFLTPHVDNAAHIGGLAGGALLSFLFPLVRTVPEGV